MWQVPPPEVLPIPEHPLRLVTTEAETTKQHIPILSLLPLSPGPTGPLTPFQSKGWQSLTGFIYQSCSWTALEL